MPALTPKETRSKRKEKKDERVKITAGEEWLASRVFDLALPCLDAV